MRKTDFKESLPVVISPGLIARRKSVGVYAQYLRHRRVMYQLSQREVARLTGVGRSTISRCELFDGKKRHKTYKVLDAFYDELDRGRTKRQATAVARKAAA